MIGKLVPDPVPWIPQDHLRVRGSSLMIRGSPESWGSFFFFFFGWLKYVCTMDIELLNLCIVQQASGDF